MCMLQESQDSMIFWNSMMRSWLTGALLFLRIYFFNMQKLHIPPGKRGQEQFSKSEGKKTKEIANLRIYVDQAMRRLKTFRLIKNELPISMLGNLDNIITVCAAICNLYKPLCKL